VTHKTSTKQKQDQSDDRCEKKMRAFFSPSTTFTENTICFLGRPSPTKAHNQNKIDTEIKGFRFTVHVYLFSQDNMT
jgi:hypothetical protein